MASSLRARLGLLLLAAAMASALAGPAPGPSAPLPPTHNPERAPVANPARLPGVEDCLAAAASHDLPPLGNPPHPLADGTWRIHVETRWNRSANLSRENALLLLALGNATSLRDPSAIQDVDETLYIRCVFTQDVALTREDAAAALVLGSNVPRPFPAQLADAATVVEITRVTRQSVHLDRESVLAILALRGRDVTADDLAAAARIERRVTTSEALRRDAGIEAGQAITAIAGTEAGK